MQKILQARPALRTSRINRFVATPLLAAMAPFSPVFAAPEPGALALEEVIVTARKREESLQEIPLSVTSITAALKDPSIRRLEDISGMSPNVIIRNTNTVPGGSAISIRGVSYQEIDKSYDPAIGVIMDGIYLGTASGQLLQNFDLARIEVLRGPQGTLFGRNTIGGVINVIRGEPTLEWGVDAKATAGDYGREDYQAVVNMPLIDDKLGLKLFGADFNSDGWIHNTTRNEDVGGDDYQTYGLTLLGRPTEDLNVKFHYERNNDKTDVGAWSNFNQDNDLVCQLAAAPFTPWTPEQACESLDARGDEKHNSTNNRNDNDTQVDTSILTLDWDLGGAQVTSITGYREQDEDTFNEYDSSAATFLYLDFYNKYDQFSQELRLASKVGDKIDYVVGLYYWESNYEQTWNTGELHYWLDQLGALTGVPGGLGLSPDYLSLSKQHQKTTSYAAFTSADWHIDEKWTATIGLRYTYEEKDFTGSDSRFFEPGDPLPQLTYTPLNDDWSEVSPKAGLAYQYNDDIMFFGSFAQGFKSGGFFGRNTDFTSAESYDPETVDTYEIGMKSEWAGSRVIFNPTAFYSEYKDKQEEVLIETAPGTVATNVLNAASVNLWGIELELQARLTEAWSVRAAYGYLDSEYDGFVADLNGDGTATDNDNLVLRNAPETTYGLSSTYTIPIGPGEFSAYVAYRFQDDIETILNNDEQGHIKGLENLDVSLAYSWDHYRIAAFGRNLTDEVYSRRVRIEPLVTFGQYTQGTNYGVELSVSF